MFSNYLKVAIRSLLKRKVFTFINIFGLATGMTVCLLIVLFIKSELGYDNFLPNADQVYRVVLDRKYPERATSYSIIPHSIGAAIQQEFPEVQTVTRINDILGGGSFYTRVGDHRFEDTKVYSADSSFFRVFKYPLIVGDTATALRQPNMTVITESIAKKYFGSAAAALGKTFETDDDNKLRFQVSGVCKDWPGNSHIAFNILIAANTFPFTHQLNYTGFSTYTYLLLHKGVSPNALEAKFPQVVDKYVSGAIARNFGMTYQQFIAAGNGYHYYLQPLQKIHLISDLEAEFKPNGSMRAVYIFGIIAIFILGIACINFINLSTARSVERAKEVGIRKTFGSEKKSLIFQFLVESVLVSMLSILVAIGLIFALLPFFNRLTGKDLSALTLITPVNVLLLLAFGFVVGLIAGLYPAFILSSFKPIKVLKGKFHSNKYGTALRNGLVIFQFSISIILIICTIIVNRQTSFMLGDKLGFKKDHIIQIEEAGAIGDRTQAFHNEILQIAGVERSSSVSSLPGGNAFWGITWQEYGDHPSMTGRGMVADDQLASTLDLQMAQGRFFSKTFATDSLALVLNEKAVAALGLKEPVLGKRLISTEETLNKSKDTPTLYTVVGVIKDFHFQTLHQAIAPLVIVNAAKFNGSSNLISVRIQGDHFASAIRSIENIWNRFRPQRPFHYSFLDQRLADQYKAEQTVQRVFTVFSVLAIFIACIGLLGLAAYATQQRIREISIRKVLGASVPNLVGMLSKNFLKLVTISALLAFPLAWLAMHSWLESFVYRTELSWWIFALAWALSIFITLLTISFQAIRAARANPIKTLRSE
jgi:putative ABC transport system permease protein